MENSGQTSVQFNRIGIIPTVEKVVARKTSTDGYAALVNAAMEDFTFEAVVLRHPTLFTAEALTQATKRSAERES